MLIYVKRAYEEPSENDGHRILVDRVWPRGVTRQRMQLDAWVRELAPSTELRKWFAHDPKKWKQFRRRYFEELDGCPEEVHRLLEMLATGRVTLVYSARNDKFNNAIALKEYLENRMGR
ncbi:MAG: DUF488 family protein [Gammaproteobacteria bacterium]|jgi:uncharacterized protein YeaO (DUF488 family)|nr:DUF488 family protein [Gammaproteobacteria bacterium]